MTRKLNRRNVLKSVGAATATSITGASIVAADDSDGSRKAEHSPFEDLKLRSFATEDREVTIVLSYRNEGGELVERTFMVPSVTNGNAPDPLRFDFHIPTGRYSAELITGGETVAEQSFWAPETGYPSNRRLVAVIRDEYAEFYEDVA